MIRFIDGPAAGQILALRRAPIMLRVVGCVRSSKQCWDALDQLGDTAQRDEQVYLYRLTARPTWYHIRAARGKSGFYWRGDYEFLQDQPSNEVLRDNASYDSWLIENKPRLMPEWAKEGHNVHG